jgi:hypothetical protein
VLAELVVPFSAERGLDPIVVGVDIPPTPSPTPADTTPPVIRGPIPDVKVLCIPPGTPDRVTFTATVIDDVGVAQVTLFYKRPGDSSFQSVTMQPVGGSTYQATVIAQDDDPWFPSDSTDQMTFFATAMDTSHNSAQSPARTGVTVNPECAPPSPTGPIIFIPIPPIIIATPTPPVINFVPEPGLLGAGPGLGLPGMPPGALPAQVAIRTQIVGELPFVVTRSAGPPVWEH